jgi:hypothetical protein
VGKSAQREQIKTTVIRRRWFRKNFAMRKKTSGSKGCEFY